MVELWLVQAPVLRHPMVKLWLVVSLVHLAPILRHPLVELWLVASASTSSEAPFGRTLASTSTSPEAPFGRNLASG